MIATIRVEDVLANRSVSYGIVQPGSSQKDGTPIVRAGDIRDGRIDTRYPMRVDPAISERHSRTILRGNELLLSVVGSVGQTAIVPPSMAGWNVARAVAVLNPIDVSTRWLHYAFQSGGVRAQIDAALNTTVQPTLNLADLKRVRLPRIALAEQKAIAEVLGALDDKIAANTALAESAEHLAQIIYDNAEGSAQRQPVSQVLTPVLGGTPSRSVDDYWGGSELWVSARDITAASSSVIVDTEEHITASAVAQTRAKPLPVGSVILTARGTVGKVARLAKQASFNQSCYGFIPGALPSSILYFAIRSATERAKAMAHGSVFDTITMGTFDHLEIADFDREATSSLEVVLRPLLDTVTTAVEENRTLAATRDALLPQLMSGKLRVRDAEAVASAAGA